MESVLECPCGIPSCDFFFFVSPLPYSPLAPAQTRAANKRSMTDFATGLIIGKTGIFIIFFSYRLN